MTQSQKYELQILNELIVATLDRAQSYFEAAARADNARLGVSFAQRAREHMEAVEQLKNQARALRGRSGPATSVIGGAYSALTGHDPEGIDDESTMQRFEKALRDIRISDLVRSVIYAARARIDDEPCLQTTQAI